MRKAIRELRLMLAETMLDWAVSVYPEGRERLSLSKALVEHFYRIGIHV